MVIYAAEQCSFEFKSGCDATTHTVAERHALVRHYDVVYGSYTEGHDALSKEASHFTP
jgi:hypothetical protein